jgi:capsular polysaccharide biosynthesis protein
MSMENEEQNIEGEISLADIWNTVRRRFLLIFFVFVVAVFLAVLSLQGKTDMYQSTAILIIEKPSNYGMSTMPDYYASQGWLQTYAEMIKGEPVLQETIKQITYPRISLATLKSSLTVQAIKDTLLLNVSFTYPQPAYAKKVVDTVSEVFVKKMADMNEANIQTYTKKLETQIAEFQKQIDTIQTDLNLPTLSKDQRDTKLNELKKLYELKGILDSQLSRQVIEAQQLTSSVKIYQEGTRPTAPSNSRDSLTMAIGGVLGLFLGLLLAFLLEYLDDTIKTEEDIKKVSNLRVLGVIPRFGQKGESAYYYPYSQGKYYKKPG